MKQLFASADNAQVRLARSVLEAEDIFCEVRNEAVSQAFPSVPSASELWVREEDFEEATRLLAAGQTES